MVSEAYQYRKNCPLLQNGYAARGKLNEIDSDQSFCVRCAESWYTLARVPGSADRCNNSGRWECPRMRFPLVFEQNLSIAQIVKEARKGTKARTKSNLHITYFRENRFLGKLYKRKWYFGFQLTISGIIFLREITILRRETLMLINIGSLDDD